MSKKVKLSALLANYNHSQYLPKAIESVAGQSRPPDEYIIVDDASTDNSVEIIKHYAEKYKFIRLIEKKTNTGNIDTRNVACAAMTGDFFHMGASDDYMLPGFLERVEKAAQEYPDVGIITATHYVEDPDGTWLEINRISNWETPGFRTPEEYLKEYLMIDSPQNTLTCSAFYSTKSLNDLGGSFPEELGIWDVSFLLQYAALRWGCYYIPTPYYSWVVHPKSATNKSNSDLNAGVRMYANYLCKAQTPPFSEYFSKTFINHWFNVNLVNLIYGFVENELTELKGEIVKKHRINIELLNPLKLIEIQKLIDKSVDQLKEFERKTALQGLI